MWHPGPDVLSAVGGALGALALALKGVERRLVEALTGRQATDPGHPALLADPSPARRLVLWRLERGGALHRQGDGVWLDPVGYIALRQRRRRRALGVLLALLLVGLALFAFGQLRF